MKYEVLFIEVYVFVVYNEKNRIVANLEHILDHI